LADLLDVHVNCVDSMLPHQASMRAKATNAHSDKKERSCFFELYMGSTGTRPSRFASMTWRKSPRIAARQFG